jgi:hypothetical protein
MKNAEKMQIYTLFQKFFGPPSIDFLPNCIWDTKEKEICHPYGYRLTFPTKD